MGNVTNILETEIEVAFLNNFRWTNVKDKYIKFNNKTVSELSLVKKIIMNSDDFKKVCR